MTQIRLKINATFTIDNREKLNDIIDLIGTELSKTFGGITFPNGLDNGTGFWISDGNDFKEKYTGTISKEPIVSFSLSVMPNHKLPRA